MVYKLHAAKDPLVSAFLPTVSTEHCSALVSFQKCSRCILMHPSSYSTCPERMAQFEQPLKRNDVLSYMTEYCLI